MTRTCPSCSGANTAEARYCIHCGGVLTFEARASDPLIGRRVADRYRIVRLIGEGAMGRVYLAEQQLGAAVREVAVKVLRLVLARDPQLAARFRRECEMVVALSHPNTIRIFDFGELDDGSLYLVMEYVRGASLAQVIAQEGALSAARVERLVLQIGGSLTEAHAQMIVHRDLKPDNILLAQTEGQKDFVKVLDFGIAKRLASNHTTANLTQQGTVLGTPPYMSPEQFLGEPLDGRTDVYSLGLIVYEMLTGRLPFEETTPLGWASAHTQSAPRPMDETSAAGAIPERMRDAVMHALEKRREVRPPDIGSFVRELTGAEDLDAAWARAAAGGGVPTLPPPIRTLNDGEAPAPPPLSRGFKWAVAGVFVVTSMALLSLGGWMAWQALAPRGQATAPPPRPDAAAVVENESPDAGGEAVAEMDPDRWFQSVHHVRNASNAQEALGHADGQAAIIRPGGMVTAEIAPDREVRSDGTAEADLVVHVPEDHDVPFLVEGSVDHHHFFPLGRSDGSSVRIDLDETGRTQLRYVRIRSVSSSPALIDAIEAPHTAPLPSAGHAHGH